MISFELKQKKKDRKRPMIQKDAPRPFSPNELARLLSAFDKSFLISFSLIHS